MNLPQWTPFVVLEPFLSNFKQEYSLRITDSHTNSISPGKKAAECFVYVFVTLTFVLQEQNTSLRVASE